jgi:cellulose synthase operon protein C
MQARQSYSICKAVFCGLMFALVSAALSGCAENLKDIRAEGVEQFRSRQYTESMATMRYALRKSPNDAEANYYMGLNYRALAERRLSEGDLPAARRTLDNAVVYFTQAVKTWPNYMAAIQAKNEALESRGKFDAALAVAERQADNNRGIADHYVYLGDEYRERADYDNALRAYRTALATDPDNARAHASMAKLYVYVGDRDMALSSFRRAHELNPAEPEPAEAIAELESFSQEEVASPPSTPITPQQPSTPGTTRIYSNR